MAPCEAKRYLRPGAFQAKKRGLEAGNVGARLCFYPGLQQLAVMLQQ